MLNFLAIRNFIKKFNFLHEKEEDAVIIDAIYKGVVFRGTNLWVLIFAIFVASLGLNVNSTAVIIGAMLISPLMGPIMGMGLGVGINDLGLFKKSLNNYAVALVTGLGTSTIYFLISPLNEAHSEILARTSPTIYDVLIAFFGGMAGSVATTSRQKGNVIPGVAIATALMPPLCTAGYGVATLNINIIFGALYLFFINTVFIGIATLITVRLMKIPFLKMPDEAANRKTKRWVYTIAILTLLPSIYFGYRIVQQERFASDAEKFVRTEVHFKNSYLLDKRIDASNKNIKLVFGGADIDSTQIKDLKKRLAYYNLEDAKLQVQQGFSFAKDDLLTVDPATRQLEGKEKEIVYLQTLVDSLRYKNKPIQEVFNEAVILFPNIVSLAGENMVKNMKDSSANNYFFIVEYKNSMPEGNKTKIVSWLEQRLKVKKPEVLFREESMEPVKAKN